MMCALLAKQAWKSKRDVVRRVDMNDTSEGHSPYSYADAGVSIAAGNALVKAIAPLARATRRPGADADLGGFGGLFDPTAAGFTDPLHLASNSGLGTKLKFAIHLDPHHGVRRSGAPPYEHTAPTP